MLVFKEILGMTSISFFFLNLKSINFNLNETGGKKSKRITKWIKF
jgi:hypothetical protein